MTRKRKNFRISTWPELGINYWGINKNASTTMREHLSFLSKKENKFIEKTRNITREEAFENGLINFGISRDPLSRFVSCYAMYKDANLEQNSSIMNSVKKIRFDQTWTIEDFFQVVKERIESGYKVNKHYQLQTWFIPEPDKLDYVIKMERLLEDWPLDIPPPSIQKNKTNGAKYHVSEELKDSIYELYKIDYEVFGYDRI